MSQNSGLLICGELAEKKLSPVTLELLGIGRKLADATKESLAIVIFGSDPGDSLTEAIAYGADKVYSASSSIYDNYQSEFYTPALVKLCKEMNPNILLLGHTSMGKDLASSAAFELDTVATLDCIDLKIDEQTHLLQQTKPIYGGRAYAVYVADKVRPQIATVRAKAMVSAVKDESREGEVVPYDPEVDKSSIKVTFLDKVKDEIEGIKLEEANIIVSGGRGIGSKEGFEPIYELAKILNGAVAGTRPAIDAGWINPYCQVGLTGKIVSPEIYIAIGISGSMQHLAGMSNSKKIVAINKDEEANIFNVAHYGVVGDYKLVLPAFLDKCKELHK